MAVSYAVISSIALGRRNAKCLLLLNYYEIHTTSGPFCVPRPPAVP